MSHALEPELDALDPATPAAEAFIAGFVDLWNAALGADMPISAAFVRHNFKPSHAVTRRLFTLTVDGVLAGAALATALHGEPLVTEHGEGWIDALVVTPVWQRRGVGRRLLHAAESWLAEQGCRSIQIGGGLRPFAPGAPEASGAVTFFAACGYTSIETVWDMAANLANYTPPPLREAPCTVAPASPRQVDDLLDFLRREFPGRWRYEAEMFLADGGRIADFMLLWTARGVDGCCLLTFPDSVRPLERFYPYQLPKPWGQLGSIGISADVRGQGFGAALLDAGLRRLHNNGVNGCVIDWTTLLDFYGKFGFASYRAYVMLGRLVRMA
jgi:GNAT superfamily N-acetyltransferase